MEVKLELYKHEGTYFSESKNKDVPYTNFFLSINGNRIPIEVKYFKQEQFGGRDPGYAGRMSVMSTFATPITASPKDKKADKPTINPRKISCPNCHKIMRVDDQDENDYYLVCDECNISAFVSLESGAISFTDSDGTDIPF